jgi:Zn-dependent protease with chaperone function
VISTGQLFLEHRRRRRKLRAASREPCHRRQAELQEVVHELATIGGVSRVRLVVSPERTFQGTASRFGGFPGERFVEITAGCVDRLSRDDLRALLAHEIGHHLAGDCRRDQFLRWLGRWSFAGDGFVLALQNSWGSEQAADLAVRRLGVSEDNLARALHRLRALRAIEEQKKARSQAQKQGGAGLPADTEAVKPPPDVAELVVRDPSALKLAERWRLGWRLFLHQYFHAMSLGLHYWHPTTDERVAALLAAVDSRSPTRLESLDHGHP